MKYFILCDCVYGDGVERERIMKFSAHEKFRSSASETTDSNLNTLLPLKLLPSFRLHPV